MSECQNCKGKGRIVVDCHNCNLIGDIRQPCHYCVNMPGEEFCSLCKDDLVTFMDCVLCEGVGIAPCFKCLGEKVFFERCPICQGTKERDVGKCGVCDGTGEIKQS